MTTKNQNIARTCMAVLAGAVTLPLVATPAAASGVEVGGSGETYFLTNDNGPHGMRVDYGRPADRTYVGDWDGDGKDTLTVRRGNQFFVKNTISNGVADHVFAYGSVHDEVIIGDWDGDGIDTPAVRRGNQYLFTNSLTGGVAEVEIVFGRASDDVVVGDWNGDGTDTIAVRRGGDFHLINDLSSGASDEVIRLGDGSGTAISGSWAGGADGVGVRVGTTAYLRNPDGGVVEVSYGRTNDSILTGDWDGDGVDTLGVRRDLQREAAEAAARAAAQAQASAREIVMNTARSKVGSAYQYAATGPNAFDCSGFTTYVYRSVGINLPRSSGAQHDWAAQNGTEVPLSQAQPGDLLWWPGHVGVYAGNGMIIDAGTYSTGVSERRLYGSPKAFRIA